MSFDLFGVSAADYPDVCKAVATAFSLSPSPAAFGAGFEAIAMDFQRAGQVVELAWDNWSGFIVTSKAGDSDALVVEIAEWLSRSTWGETGAASPRS
ncbi:hypothetical protein AB1L88_24465 [Tautonia sp. JC769]|uniref:hypothetical protein n=1 Tax=Tautonia sp. JC769 TaxID=3232135 RepID=UPI0034579E92